MNKNMFCGALALAFAAGSPIAGYSSEENTPAKNLFENSKNLVACYTRELRKTLLNSVQERADTLRENTDKGRGLYRDARRIYSEIWEKLEQHDPLFMSKTSQNLTQCVGEVTGINRASAPGIYTDEGVDSAFMEKNFDYNTYLALENGMHRQLAYDVFEYLYGHAPHVK